MEDNELETTEETETEEVELDEEVFQGEGPRFFCFKTKIKESFCENF